MVSRVLEKEFVISTNSDNPAPSDSSKPEFELGLYSFAELTPDPNSGKLISPAHRVHDLLESIELAEQVGLDVFALGEHHRPDFVSSTPAVILAAAAARRFGSKRTKTYAKL